MLQKKKLLPYFLAIVLATALLDVKPVSSPTTAKLRTNPPILHAAPGESFLVNITVSDALFLYSWQVVMGFNPDVLEFVNVTEGDFLERQPEGTSLAGIRVEEDWVLFGWSTDGAFAGESGSGVLATVEFRALAVGESVLDFTNKSLKKTKLLEQDSPIFPPQLDEMEYTAEDGLFTNTLTPPVADFTYSPEIPGINQTITFDASASSGGSNATSTFEIVEYFWDFDDGTNATVANPTVNHTYTTGGIFTASLTVFDNATASELVKSQFNETDTRAQMGLMPWIWYELYSTKTTTIGIAFAHDIAVTNVSISKEEVTAGEPVSINVTVLNKGTEPESFTVTVYYDTNEIEPSQQVSLDPGEEETLIFSWDTTGVAEGDYQIKAVASGVEDEGNVIDNEFIDGTVTVKAASGSFPTTLIIIGGAIGVGVVLVVIVLYMRRKSVPST